MPIFSIKFRKLVISNWSHYLLFLRACLVGGIFFFGSKLYENHFQKIEIKTSFQIIIFTLFAFGYHF